MVRLPASLTSHIMKLNLIATAGTFFSKVVAGALSDHFSAHTIGFSTSFGCGASVLLSFGLFGNQGWIYLMVFAFTFGFTSGAWPSLYFGVIKVWLRECCSYWFENLVKQTSLSIILHICFYQANLN